MPLREPDATDPMILHGVSVETDQPDAMRHMAACFIEEYLRMGFDPDRVFKMFKTVGYAGPQMAYKALGEAAIRAMLDEQIAIRGPHVPAAVPIATNQDSTIALSVLDS